MQKRVRKEQVDRFLTAWFAVRQLIQAANFNRFQSAGLSATQFMTLNLLPDSADGIPMGALARSMNLRAATVAKTVDSLEARRLLSRERSQLDGRSVLVKITPQGRRLQNAAAGQFRSHMVALFTTMSAEERGGLVEGLEALVRVSHPNQPEARTSAATPEDAADRPVRNARRSRPR